MESNKAVLLLISGPAGIGKTTLCTQLCHRFPEIHRVVTTTTRHPRPNEHHGQDYYFLGTDVFQAKIANGEFYEHARVYGNHYGVLKQEIDSHLNAGVDLLLNIDVQGATSFRHAASANSALASRMLSVFILPRSLNQLLERLQKRGTDDAAEIERRLNVAEQEIREADSFDYRIISGTPDEDFQALETLYRTRKATGHAFQSGALDE